MFGGRLLVSFRVSYVQPIKLKRKLIASLPIPFLEVVPLSYLIDYAFLIYTEVISKLSFLLQLSNFGYGFVRPP